jgi:hypothetical protein
VNSSQVEGPWQGGQRLCALGDPIYVSRVNKLVELRGLSDECPLKLLSYLGSWGCMGKVVILLYS